MVKFLKYIGIVAIVLVVVFIIFKYVNGRNKTLDDVDSKNMFEDPESIVYEIKGEEQFRLTKENEEYSKLLEKLNAPFKEENPIKR